ncbi:PREDICTED: zinc finger MYM-type protein 2-like [Acropora digitifera]|uniref:zinc finger MYM-type protein 2-like n=1 Tax=Acropora digitifera TaxID=70779 RepID=UPI00077A17DB|nr:PREDICTED: zinc finger MYM-type protein 2-like [Acropora digitifera]
MPPKELNEYISEFIIAVRRTDGEEFEPFSLRGLICSFNRHLKACKYPCSVFEDGQFEQVRQALEARRKALKNDGKGNKPKAAEAITDEEVNILYDKQLLGISNAEALLNTMWFMNTKQFGLRGCDEHRRMKWGGIQLLRDVNGAEYLEFLERQTKTRTGAEPRNVRAVKPKAYSFANGSPNRDPLFVYKVYTEKRPSSMTDSDSPFYLGVNHTKNPTEKLWFKASAMGVNKLNSLLQTMADEAGFDDKRRLTNHSARKTMIQKLNDNNIPPTYIMQLFGHGNVQNVNNYSTVSNEQQKTCL